MGAAPSQITADEVLAQTFWVCTSCKIFGVFVGLLLLVYMHIQQRKCQLGDVQASSALILPIYKPVIAGLLLTMSVEITLLCIGRFHGGSDEQQVMSWFIYELSRDGFVMLFIQQSLSRNALFRSLGLAMIWPLFGMMCAFIIIHTDYGYRAALLFHGTPAAFHLLIALPLPAFLRLPTRSPIVPYSIWMCLYRSCWVLYYLMRMELVTMQLHYPVLALAALLELPLTCGWYLVMRADTHYWHYGGNPKWRLWGAGHDKVLDRLEIGLLADAGDDVVQDHVQGMIESNRAHLIHFGSLQVKHDHVIGAGSFSRVFEGVYRKKRVAVKFFVRMTELVPDMIEAFARETQTHANFKHENVIKFYGLCVCPPAIALVTELCEGGSLLDCILEQQERREQATFSTAGSASNASSLKGSEFNSHNRDLLTFTTTSTTSEANSTGNGSNMTSFTESSIMTATTAPTTIGTDVASHSDNNKIEANNSNGRNTNSGSGSLSLLPPHSNYSVDGQWVETPSKLPISGAPSSSSSSSSSSSISGSRLGPLISAESIAEEMAGLWSLRTRISLARDAAAAIAYIHSLGVIHRDIKSPNFLVSGDLRLKLTDFGLTRTLLADPRFLTEDHAPLRKSPEEKALALLHRPSAYKYQSVDSDASSTLSAECASNVDTSATSVRSGDEDVDRTSSLEEGSEGKSGYNNNTYEKTQQQGRNIKSSSANGTKSYLLVGAGASQYQSINDDQPLPTSKNNNKNNTTNKATKATSLGGIRLDGLRSSKSPSSSASSSLGLKTGFPSAEALIKQALHLTRGVGTRLWMAPEVMAAEAYSFPADVFSLGIVLWEILACDLPPDSRSEFWRPEFPADVPYALKDVVLQCIHVDAKMRPSAAHVESLFNKVLQGMFALAPANSLVGTPRQSSNVIAKT